MTLAYHQRSGETHAQYMERLRADPRAFVRAFRDQIDVAKPDYRIIRMAGTVVESQQLALEELRRNLAHNLADQTATPAEVRAVRLLREAFALLGDEGAGK